MKCLDERELTVALQELANWSVDRDVLVRAIKRRNWREAIALVDAVAAEADRRDHHPDVCVTGYRNVAFRLTTHSEGGITTRDVDFARWIEELVATDN